MSGLSNIFLENYMFPRCKNFKGVFSVDMLSQLSISTPCCFIANLAKSNTPGTHFVSIYISKKNILWYFDSYGFLPPIWNNFLLQFLRPWIEKNQFRIVLDYPIQDISSIFCGWFAAAFCLTVGGNLKWNCTQFLKNFHKQNLKENDNNVTCLIKKIEIDLNK